MTIPYHHTQRGTLMMAALFVAAIASAVGAYASPSPSRWVLAAITAGFVLLVWLFSSLTVDVDEQDVRWHFGPGIWTYRIARADIENAEIVRNNWSDGFGIRMRPGLRLYNVSGLEAVELRLRTGDRRRIGTDDARGLIASLKP